MCEYTCICNINIYVYNNIMTQNLKIWLIRFDEIHYLRISRITMYIVIKYNNKKELFLNCFFLRLAMFLNNL